MARQQAGESKAPLVIALAFFVLATLVLTVLFIMARGDITEARNKEKEASDKERAATTKLSEEQAKVLAYKVLIGTNTEAEFENLKSGGKDEVARKELASAMEGIQNRLKGTVTRESKEFVGSGVKFNVTPDQVVVWKWPEGAKLESPPERPMVDAVVASYARQQLAAVELQRKQADLAQALKTYQDELARTQKEQAEFKRLSAEFPKQVADIQAKASQLVDAVRQGFAKKTTEYNADMKAKADQIEQVKIQLDDAVAKAQGLTNQVKRFEDQEGQRADPFKYDTPHGKIIRRQGNMVTIDLGSSDNVRPGLTFSVQPSDTPERGLQSRTRPRMDQMGRPITDSTGRPLREVYPKGTIEVVEVLGPNVSQARITSNPDPTREPVLVGDLLYNPAWRKGGADHVVLFGVFDVDADGIDDIRRVVRDLSKMGVAVDAYFDLEKKQWVTPDGKPTKPTELTAYAVEGYYPVQAGGDPFAAAKSALDTALHEARNQAKDKGIKVVKARDFFNRIGYKTRQDITPDDINRAYNRYLQTTPGGAEGATPPAGGAENPPK